MAFLIYKEYLRNNQFYIIPSNQRFSLAGYNAIYDLWNEKGNPIDIGWHISKEELSTYYQNKLQIESPLHFLIDFHPKSFERIGFIEILDIFVFTVKGNNKNEITWSPLMFRMQDIFYKEYGTTITSAKKEKQISIFPYPPKNEINDFVEFLYLNGSKRGWNWGKNGMTNATFIQGKVRDYFRQYF
jgi:hypothetical protein